MKKLVMTVSFLSMLALSAVPAFADQNDGNINIKGNEGTIQIKNSTEVNNVKVNLDDINGHWAEKYIKDLVSKGILQGEENRHFHPNQHVTREQFAAMVARMFHLKNTSTTQDFVDVPQTRWSYQVIEATKDYFDAYVDLNGGYDFHPAQGARREDVTVTLVKVLMKMNPSIQLMDAADADQLLQGKFKDAGNIAEALRPYVATAVQNNLIQGDDQGRFNPEHSLTRAEAAALLDRLSDLNVVVGVPSAPSIVTGSTSDGSLSTSTSSSSSSSNLSATSSSATN